MNPIEEILEKYGYRAVWDSLLTLEQDGSWETPAWAEELKMMLSTTYVHAATLVVVYRWVAKRAIEALDNEARRQMREALGEG